MFLNKSKKFSTSIKRNGLKQLKNQNFQECISLNEKKIPASLMLGFQFSRIRKRKKIKLLPWFYKVLYINNRYLHTEIAFHRFLHFGTKFKYVSWNSMKVLNHLTHDSLADRFLFYKNNMYNTGFYKKKQARFWTNSIKIIQDWFGPVL